MYIMLSKRETRLLILKTETFQSTVVLYCFICILTCAWQAMYLPLVNKHYYYGAKIIWSTKITINQGALLNTKMESHTCFLCSNKPIVCIWISGNALVQKMCTSRACMCQYISCVPYYCVALVPNCVINCLAVFRFVFDPCIRYRRSNLIQLYLLILLTTQQTQSNFYNICTMLAQRRSCLANVVQMLYKCVVFTG